jgi:dTDP-glucose pyrophosphorylase
MVQLSEGYLDVTRESGNHWSFAKLSDESNRLSKVVETTEKRRISDNCCTGLYAFRSGTQYLQIFDNFYRAGRSELSTPSELFIAPMYNSIVTIGQGVRIHDIDRNNVVFVGTPHEYQSAQDRWEWD